MELEKLIKLLKDNKELNVGVRLGILLGLYYTRSAWFKELLEATGLNKAELYQHLKILHKSGYVEIKYIPTVEGKRLKVFITKKGDEVVRQVVELLRKK
ncbi:transcriptional regulator [Sulfurisphaera ohwakuensis]|uniref:ArsR family transcriptional regulator n=1 Tax=Sulfurisphaera ohwakuensis TaxID=69656 RepID=A0A650CF08_SULOH|nr:transcriptional regulator [Sulfurisphaera ohwakuensis]MBB5254352.1 DNA-binding MarR family transcriptional regulator [Sulfurisphaera ohwakuensis]QGR16441.1 ArsR family transcriptional regulator [Sulfurisphaera ohwakuensis]